MILAELKPLVPYLKRYKRDYAWGALVTVLSNAVWIFFPLIIRAAINDLSSGVTRRKLLYYGCGLVALAIVKGFFLFWTRWILIGISRDIEFNLRNDLFAQLEKQPAAYFQRNRTGDIMARMTNDLNAVRHATRAGDHVQREHHPLYHRRAVFPASHLAHAHARCACPSAACQHPGAGAWSPHP